MQPQYGAAPGVACLCQHDQHDLSCCPPSEISGCVTRRQSWAVPARPYRRLPSPGGQWCLGSSWARIFGSSTVTPRPGPSGTLSRSSRGLI